MKKNTEGGERTRYDVSSHEADHAIKLGGMADDVTSNKPLDSL